MTITDYKNTKIQKYTNTNKLINPPDNRIYTIYTKQVVLDLYLMTNMRAYQIQPTSCI